VALRAAVSLALTVVCPLVVFVPRAAAQHIVTDGSLGKAGPVPGAPNYMITADLGKQIGSNLFHSFSQFNLSSTPAESATFSGPAGISNVISRVTGGASSVDGAIRSAITGANLYLINPNGIIFGQHATVNISGSFHASTADYLKMSDGTLFQATNPGGSTAPANTIITATPAAFGFLTTAPAKITVNGSGADPNNLFGVPTGQTLGLVGGPVTITGGTLRAPAGTIHITGATGMGEVPINPTDASALPVTSFAPVDIKSSGSTRSLLTASNAAGATGRGGSVFIRSSALTIDSSTIAANNSGSGPGGQIVLRGDNQVTLSNTAMLGNFAQVQAFANSSGSGASVSISTAPAGVVQIDGYTVSSLTTSAAANAGPGGAISIIAGQLALHNGANVLAGSCVATAAADCGTGSGPAAGAGGPITVSAGSLTIDSGAELATVAKGTGNAGNISVMVSGPVAIDIGATLSTVDGIGSLAQSRGDAGNVTLSAAALTLTRNGLVSSQSMSGALGNSGNVSVEVSGMLSIDGSGGNSTPMGPIPTGIRGNTLSSGHGGDVMVNAGRIAITGGACAVGGGTCSGIIASEVNPGASGAGGNVTVAAGSINITGSGKISTSTFGAGNSGRLGVSVADGLAIDGANAPGSSTGIFSQANARSTGNAGIVGVDAGSISVINGGTISGGTFGPGNGGSVAVTTAGELAIDGSLTPGSFTGISSQANKGSTGNAGPISISAGSISLANQGQIFSLSLGSGNPGEITVNAGALSIASNSVIGSPVVGSPTSTGSGKGGSVSLRIDGQLTIDGAGGDPIFFTGITAQSQSAADAGSIGIAAGSLSIAHNGAISSNTFGSGSGGSVSVTVAGQLLIDATTAASSLTGIATNSEFGSTGNAGDVIVNAGRLSLVNGGAISSSAIRADNNMPASSGNGGSVTVNVAGLLSMTGSGARIATETQPGTTGNAGSVAVSAPQITITSGAEIASTTAGTGAGGTVAVTTPGSLALGGGAQIAASAIGPNSGPGGSVTVTANTLTVQGSAQIASSTAGPGKGGDVDVVVASGIVLPDPGPQITARSTGSGDAGSVTVSALRLQLGNGAAISTDAKSSANGGNIRLSVSDIVYLMNSQITTSVKGETGNGGNITIDPQFVVLDRSQIIAQAVKGQGGNIRINANEFLASADSLVSASSEFGVSGTVEIIGPRVDLNGALVVLSSQLRSAAQVLRNSCAAQAGLPQSSLVEGGRGGLPQDPDATLAALYIAGRDMSPAYLAVPGPPPPIPAQQTTARLTMHCG
jgi:filamentous hemagglutinin family protein